MKTVRLCFLWHMHQPYYTDPVTGSVSMPWVRLHATKAYYDMAEMLDRFPTVRTTINFTPSLLLQLQELASGSLRDLFWEHAHKPAADLTFPERAFLVRHFFAANWTTMIRPYPRYHELLVKRGTDVHDAALERIARQFSTQELLDLQVWHNLTWFGYGMTAHHPPVSQLRRKDRGYTEQDKQVVLALQQEALRAIAPLYRRLADRGQIELTTSPFYHPILPLVIDTDSARRAQPESQLPSRFQAPDDAAAQLEKAVRLHAEQFGRAPAGLWPPEGSVCPEAIPLLRQAGISWCATDEGILARSLPGWQRQRDLYRPYLAGSPGQEVAMIFRDRDLSDAFGFVYSKATPESAVENALYRIQAAAEQSPDRDLLLSVILDGENPWEYYFDGGNRFLSGLYGALANGAVGQTRVTALTVSDALAAQPPTMRLDRLHTGSWINSDLKIWIGHPEDNRGWELLRETRARLVEASGNLPPEQARLAWDELYAAEGSDWFWWYGDDFASDYKTEFDRLFLMHLRNVYGRAGLAAPDFLNEPILQVRESSPIEHPVNLILPILDGRESDFFEWRGAGTINTRPPLGVMWRGARFLSAIHFGFSTDALFLRFDPATPQPADQACVTAEVHLLTDAGRYKLAFPFSESTVDTFALLTGSTDNGFTEVGRYGAICRGKIIELAVPLKDLGLHAGAAFRLSIVMSQNNLEIERHPRHQPAVLTVPDEHFEATMWKV